MRRLPVVVVGIVVLTTVACNPVPRSDNSTATPDTSTASENGSANGKTVTLDDIGISFTMPADLVEDDAVTEGGSWSASRLGRLDSAGLVVFPCPGCTRDDVDDGTSSISDTTVDGYPAIRADDPEVGTYSLLIFADGREIGVTMITSDPETEWRDLVDSIEIVPA